MKLFSSVSKTYLSDMYPEKGDVIEVRLSSSVLLEKAILRYDGFEGLYSDCILTLEGFKDNSYIYKGEMEIFQSDEKLSYFFIVFSDGKPYYYSKDGIKEYPPSFHSRFIIIPSLSAPKWVSSANCYQIFPDRFYNGDKSNDVKEGEYEFDGALVQAKSFSDIPEEFEISRCLDFYNGDLKGIENKLEYLKELGITMLYLNPIFTSRTVHRYDALSFFEIDPKLGGDQALISLVEKAHSMGIKLVLDISINHVGTDSQWYKRALSGKEEKEFFTHNPDGSIKFWQGVRTLADLNYESEKLRDIIYRSPDSAMQRFIKDPFNIDGWRLDVAPEVGRTKEKSLCLEIWREARAYLKALKSDLYLVGEGWDDSFKYLDGDAWDATMNYFGSSRLFRMALGEEDRYLQTGWGYNPKTRDALKLEDLAEALNCYLDNNNDQFKYFMMNLIDSHDTPRLHNHEQIMHDDKYLSLVSLLYFLPGFPSIYYGDEIKLDGRISSVEGCRYPMQWDEDRQNKKYLLWHKALGKIRKKDGFGESAYKIESLSENTLSLTRYLEDESIVLIINFDESNFVTDLDPFMLKGDKSSLILGDGKANGYKVEVKGKCSAIFSFK